jgi:hypothetical protein
MSQMPKHEEGELGWFPVLEMWYGCGGIFPDWLSFLNKNKEVKDPGDDGQAKHAARCLIGLRAVAIGRKGIVAPSIIAPNPATRLELSRCHETLAIEALQINHSSEGLVEFLVSASYIPW